jgi:hypothetical protein
VLNCSVLLFSSSANAQAEPVKQPASVSPFHLCISAVQPCNKVSHDSVLGREF